MGVGRTSKGDEESSMTWERKSRTYGPNFLSVENNHQVPQQNSMFAVIDGENGTGRILSLALMERYGDKKSEGMARPQSCLRLRGRN